MAKVLAVDDEPETLTFLVRFLRELGHEVVTAASGAEALEKAEANPPHVVLLDVKMPGLDGLEVLRRLRGRGVPVILVTAMAEEALRRRDRCALEGTPYLAKPVDLGSLEMALGGAIAPRPPS
ncbi:MAG: response regulator [Nitrospinota bacterium]